MRVKRELLASRYKIQFLATGDTAIPCLLTFLIIARKNSPNKILLFPARNTAVVHKSREFRLRFSYLLHETWFSCTKVENLVDYPESLATRDTLRTMILTVILIIPCSCSPSYTRQDRATHTGIQNPEALILCPPCFSRLSPYTQLELRSWQRLHALLRAPAENLR